MSFRTIGTKSNGGSFDEATVQQVWEKGQVAFGLDSRLLRRDRCGAIISRDQYGNTNSAQGWEIDHVIPVAKGGDDNLPNLQPLQWQNNRHKGDDYPNWTCLVRA